MQLIRVVALSGGLLLARIASADEATTSADRGAAPATPSPIVGRASIDSTAYTDSDHVTVQTPVANVEVGDRLGTWNVHGQYLVDVITAASVDIVSTASQHWREVRQAGEVGASYQPGDIGGQVSGAISVEPDYHSLAGGGSLDAAFDEKNVTALLGYFYDHDTIGRAGTPFSVFSHNLVTHTIAGGVTLTLNHASVLSLVNDLIIENGDQSKPYRYIPMFSPDVAPTIRKGASIDTVNAERLQERPLERLPTSRDRFALTARYGYRFSHGTLRAEERVYTDTWSLHASTTELRYYANVTRRFMLWPLVRVHVQNGVYFWSRAYVSTFGENGGLPEYRTGDRELGPLVSVTGGGGGSYGVGPHADPSSLSVRLQLSYVRTQFLDDLYLTSRDAFMGTLGIEGVFE